MGHHFVYFLWMLFYGVNMFKNEAKELRDQDHDELRSLQLYHLWPWRWMRNNGRLVIGGYHVIAANDPGLGTNNEPGFLYSLVIGGWNDRWEKPPKIFRIVTDISHYGTPVLNQQV